MNLKQVATDVVNRCYSTKQEHVPEIIRRLHEAVVQCNPLDYEVIEAEYFSEEGIADTRLVTSLHSFIEGVRFAERMHGVTEVK